MKRSTRGEGHERRYFYGSVWAVCLAQPVLWFLWAVLPQTDGRADVVKLAAFLGVLAGVGWASYRGKLPRTRPHRPRRARRQRLGSYNGTHAKASGVPPCSWSRRPAPRPPSAVRSRGPSAGEAGATPFDASFRDKTMRVDYYHSGGPGVEIVALDRVVSDGPGPAAARGWSTT